MEVIDKKDAVGSLIMLLSLFIGNFYETSESYQVHSGGKFFNRLPANLDWWQLIWSFFIIYSNNNANSERFSKQDKSFILYNTISHRHIFSIYSKK
ncbi:MAG: hypothetical protein ABF874_10235 [Liquorilactobacillus nagelii]|uniref:hypothetical protein n=1 Tax=Liquorilactobacillus nagelii TaxID=82688 RepID=UPI0039E92B3E